MVSPMNSITDFLNVNSFDRFFVDNIKNLFDDNTPLVFSGQRHSGKTSLLYSIVTSLQQNEVIDDKNFIFFDLENIADFSKVNEPIENFLRFLILSGKSWSSRRKLYLFIDNLHLLDDPEKLVSVIFSNYKQIKIFATLSALPSSLKKFSVKINDCINQFTLPPLSFQEYLTLNDNTEFDDVLFKNLDCVFEDILFNKKEAKVYVKNILPLFENYLLYGGFPAVASQIDIREKQSILSNIFDDYVRKDVNTLYKIDQLNSFKLLIYNLSLDTSDLLNNSKLISKCKLNPRTLTKYLDVMEYSFCINRLFPYDNDIGIRLIRSSKIYFTDNGIRNCVINDFSSSEQRKDVNVLVESFINQSLNRIIKNTDKPLCFWRTSNHSETDFIFNDIAIDVKADKTKRNPPRQMVQCMNALDLNRGIVINKDRYEKVIIDNKEILFLPYCFIGF